MGKEVLHLELVHESGGKIEVRVNTAIGQANCLQFGEDARYWSDPQFALERGKGGWFVAPDLGAKNETLLNGRAVTSRMPLANGDLLGAGKEEKNVVKLPLRVELKD